MFVQDGVLVAGCRVSTAIHLQLSSSHVLVLNHTSLALLY